MAFGLIGPLKYPVVAMLGRVRAVPAYRSLLHPIDTHPDSFIHTRVINQRW